MDIRQLMSADLPDALKWRDTETVSVLRTTLAAIGNAEAVPLATTRSWPVVGPTEVPRRQLTEDEVAQLVRGEMEEREAAAEVYRTAGRPEMAERLDAGSRLLAGYLTSGL